MKMVTVAEAAKALGVSRPRLTRALDAGKIPSMPLGCRRVVELETARAYFDSQRSAGVGMDALMTATGLKAGAIRRGMREGWIPYWRDEGTRLRYDLDAVYAAIDRRMQGNSEK